MMSFNQAPCSLKSPAFDVTIATIDLFKYYAFKLRQQNSYPLIRDLQIKPSKYLRKWVQTSIINDRYTFFEHQDGQILADVKFTMDEQVYKLFYQLLCALFTVHQSQSLGRCFNVNNILMNEDNDIVLMEFGFYPMMQIIAPEQLQSMNNYNLKLDVYLIGRVLYHVMVRADVPEINGQFNTQAQYLHIYNTLATTAFSQNLKNLVISMLHYDTDRRPNFVKLLQIIKEHPAQIEMKGYYLRNSKQLNDNISLCASQREQQVNNLIETQNIEELIEFTMKLDQTQEMDELQMVEINIKDQTPSLIYKQSDIQHTKAIEATQTLHQTNRSSSIRILSVTKIETDYGPPQTHSTGNIQLTQEMSTDSLDDIECHRRLTILAYRHTFISDTLNMLVKLDDSEESLISISEFCLRKMLVILMKQFMQQIKDRKNIIGVQEQKWNNFINKPQNIAKYTLGMEFKLAFHTAGIKTFHTGLLQKLKNIENVDLSQYGTFISPVVTENTFEEAKNPYRLALTRLTQLLNDELTYHLSKSTNVVEQTKLKLRLVTCLAINRLFDIEQIEQLGVFNPMLQCLNIQQISDSEDFVNYYQVANVENMQKQIKMIQQVIFNK